MSITELPPSNRALNLSTNDVGPIVLLMALKLVAILLVFLAGWRFLIYDEPCRFMMTLGWIDNPFFAPGDFVWLGGFFWVAGLWLKIFGETFVAAKALAIVFGLASIAGAYWAGLILYESRAMAFLTGLVYMAGHVNTWSSMAFMPEIFVIAFTLWGVAFFLFGLMNNRPWAVLAAMACLGFSATFRYEQWVLLGCIDVLLVILVAMRRINLSTFAIAVVLANWFIWVWMLLSWKYLGHPLQFLKASQAVTNTVEGNPLVYMWIRVTDFEPLIFKVGLLANLLCLAFGNRWLRSYAAMVLAFGLLYALTMKVGTAMSTWRIVQGWRALLTLMVPALLLWPLRHRLMPEKFRPAVFTLGLLLGFWHFGTETARAQKPIMWGFDNDTMALAEALRLEQFNRTFTKPQPKDRPTYLLLTNDRSAEANSFWIFAYMLAGRQVVVDAAIPDGVDIIVTRQKADDPEGWTLQHRVGAWRVYLPTLEAVPAQ